MWSLLQRVRFAGFKLEADGDRVVVHRHVGVVEGSVEEDGGCQHEDEVEDGWEEAEGGPAQPPAPGLQGAAQPGPDRGHAGGGLHRAVQLGPHRGHAGGRRRGHGGHSVATVSASSVLIT